MKISVALCTYNGEEYISDQLNSYLNQTRQPDEIIVCDDGSTDNTLPILENFSERAEFDVVIYRNEVNLGSTRNFEKAVSLCTGDIIVLSDQDDVWLPTKLQQFEDAFNAHPDVMLVSSDLALVDRDLNKLVHIDKNSNTVGMTVFGLLEFSRDEMNQFMTKKGFKLLLAKNYFTGSGMAIRKETLDDVLPVSDRWVHDEWISIIISICSSIYVIDEPLTLYRQHGANLIGVSQMRGGNPGPSYRPRLALLRFISAIKIPQDVYFNQVPKFIDLINHVSKLNLCCELTADFKKLDDEIKHFMIRSQLPDNIVDRTLIIWSEIRNKRYQKYSAKGLLSAIRDMIAGIL